MLLSDRLSSDVPLWSTLAEVFYPPLLSKEMELEMPPFVCLSVLVTSNVEGGWVGRSKVSSVLVCG